MARKKGAPASDGDLGADLDHAVGGDLEVRRRVLRAARQRHEQPILPGRHLGLRRRLQVASRQEKRRRADVDVEILARYIDVVGRSQAEVRIYELPLQTWTAIPGSSLRMRHALRAIWELALIAARPWPSSE